MKITVTPNPKAFKRIRSINEALRISKGDMAGPVLVRLGQTHIKQQKRIFASQGAEGAGGRFAPLNPRYAARKLSIFGRKKILDLTGNMRRRFTKKSDPSYVQDFIPGSKGKGTFRFGARSNIAAAHKAGNPDLAPTPSTTAKGIWGGRAPRLPVRDMITKTGVQVAQLRKRFVDWYRKERLPQVLRNKGKL